ncbi:putative nuclease HARBI1 [Montipora foliosa]|uniref:putative nuclease HARBI1 n=1 Tax=Montipora foliosa TaxID=591990 RepID=UPI0035F1E35F
MAAVGALLTPNLEKRKHRQRTVLTGINRCEVIERFRLSPERIEWLILKFEGQLRRNTGRNASLDPEIQVLAALRYLASESFLKVVADTMGISKASASRCVHSFTQCLSIAGEWIIFPTSREEVNETMTKFYSIGAFPKVMGAIDGTLIPIRAPGKEEHLYVCHKGFMPSSGDLAKMAADF